MKASKKRGFTIIELVIVIAVIAILAAVLIPTFSNVIQKAKEASDTSMIRNLNNALKMDAGNEHKTMQQAIDAVADGGFVLTKIKATADSSKVLWDSKNDCFVYLKKGATEPTYIPDTKKETAKAEDLWEIVETVDGANKYSQYLNNDSITTATVISGFDAGSNTKLETVTYSTPAEKDVTIRTNGGTLVIDAASSDVSHYGLVDKVEIEAVAPSSYHEYNYVTSYISIKSGNVIIENGASVSILAVAGANVTATQKGELFKVVPVGDVTINTSNIKVTAEIATEKVTADALKTMKYGGGDGKAADTAYELYTASHLAAFAKDVNDGKFAEYVYAKLGADINIGNMGWEPIGNAEHPFYGSFDGNGQKIVGLTNKGYAPAQKLWGVTSTAGNTGAPYGFFGVVGNANKELTSYADISIKDIVFENVAIDIDNTNMLGIAVGADIKAAKIGNNRVNTNYNGNIAISGITTSGSLICTNGASVGGIAGKFETLGTLTLENCKNEATLTLSNNDKTDIKAGGILGFTQNGCKATIKNCISAGNITVNASGSFYVGGMISFDGNSNVTKFENGSVTAKIQITTNGNIARKDAALVYGSKAWTANENTATIETVDVSKAMLTLDGSAITDKYVK